MKKDRRQFIKTASSLSIGVSAPTGIFNIISSKKNKGHVIGHGDFTYKVEKDWCQLDHRHTPIINCHEMVMDSKKRLIMVTDHPKNNVIIMDQSGKLIDTWTLGYTSAHGLTIHDEGGTEYLYITDPNTGSVVKTTMTGEIILTIDPRQEGFYKECQSFRPTETAIGPNGDIYVADGYGSQYITQYDSKGKGIRMFGGDSFLQPNKFKQVHGVTIDHRDSENPTLICTARIKNAFKRFSLDGHFIEDIYLPGAFVSRPVIDDDMLYSGVCFGMQPNKPLITQHLGFVTIINSLGKVVSNPGGQEPVYVEGELQTMYQDQPIFSHCHDVCVDGDKNLYVLQWNAKSVYPYKLMRV